MIEWKDRKGRKEAKPWHSGDKKGIASRTASGFNMLSCEAASIPTGMYTAFFGVEGREKGGRGGGDKR